MSDFNTLFDSINSSTLNKAAESKVRYVFSIQKNNLNRIKKLFFSLENDFNSSEIWINKNCINLIDMKRSLKELDDSDSGDFYFDLTLNLGDSDSGVFLFDFSNAYSISYFKEKSQIDISLSLFLNIFSDKLFTREGEILNNEHAAMENRKLFNSIFNRAINILKPYRIEFEVNEELDFVWILGMRIPNPTSRDLS